MLRVALHIITGLRDEHVEAQTLAMFGLKAHLKCSFKSLVIKILSKPQTKGGQIHDYDSLFKIFLVIA